MYNNLETLTLEGFYKTLIIGKLVTACGFSVIQQPIFSKSVPTADQSLGRTHLEISI